MARNPLKALKRMCGKANTDVETAVCQLVGNGSCPAKKAALLKTDFLQFQRKCRDVVYCRQLIFNAVAADVR